MLLYLKLIEFIINQLYFSKKGKEKKWIVTIYTCAKASLVVQLEKNLPTMQETSIWFLVCEDPLEKG